MSSDQNQTVDLDFQKLVFNLITNLKLMKIDKDDEKSELANTTSYADLFQKFDELLEGKHDCKLSYKNSKESTEARQAGNQLYYESKNYDPKSHAKALSLYMKSIAFAKNNSEEMAMGYNCRIGLLIHLKKYKECLMDIKRAYEVTESVVLQKNLADRERECILKLEKGKKSYEPEPQTFNFKSSIDIPCASELVKLEYDEKYGRHVVATQDIQPGTIIAVEKGVVLYPIVENQYFICSHCLSTTWTGIPCQSCTVTIYCSEKCQKEAWQEYHDIECPILPYFDFLINDLDYYSSILNTLLFTTRLFIKIIKTEGLLSIIREAKVIDQDKGINIKKVNCLLNGT